MLKLRQGYWVSTPQVLTGVVYVGLYEFTRHLLKHADLIHDHSMRSLIAGGAASACVQACIILSSMRAFENCFIAQTIAVPCDVISQHMMIIGNLRQYAVADSQLTSASRSFSERVADPLNLAEKVRLCTSAIFHNCRFTSMLYKGAPLGADAATTLRRYDTTGDAGTVQA